MSVFGDRYCTGTIRMNYCRIPVSPSVAMFRPRSARFGLHHPCHHPKLDGRATIRTNLHLDRAALARKLMATRHRKVRLGPHHAHDARGLATVGRFGRLVLHTAGCVSECDSDTRFSQFCTRTSPPRVPVKRHWGEPGHTRDTRDTQTRSRITPHTDEPHKHPSQASRDRTNAHTHHDTHNRATSDEPGAHRASGAHRTPRSTQKRPRHRPACRPSMQRTRARPSLDPAPGCAFKTSHVACWHVLQPIANVLFLDDSFVTLFFELFYTQQDRTFGLRYTPGPAATSIQRSERQTRSRIILDSAPYLGSPDSAPSRALDDSGAQ